MAIQGREEPTRRVPPLKGWRKESQSDVVRVVAREPRAVAGIDDATIDDTEFRQPYFPCLQLISVPTGEGQMVQTNSTLIEGEGVGRIGNS
jgi:hypothetical protein